MKGFCIKSLAVGLGIGMILTASFNIFMEPRMPEENVTPIVEEENTNDLEKSIENLKKNFDNQEEPEKEEEDLQPLVEENTGLENTEEADNPEEIKNPEETENPEVEAIEEESEYHEIYITGGMISTEIAQLLMEEGAIEDASDFVNYLIINNAATKIKIGRKIIPMGSSYDEIVKILLDY
ncbi:hypothetical protein [Alkaliphilus serpentinus]|uniref:Endolytic transglycosylase MltG n=1 Tax=Alkaliphilus serpentinus TaxID=1482731 RepID=A0A833MEH9_9FIRM|nr:hypothetical protein [Alkaliphilus serpentinus]KAB3531354.1 endolytic transglycosylase MltG [Alkaliphilus serpentinus]